VLFFISLLMPATLMAQDTTPPRLNRSVLSELSAADAAIPSLQAEFVIAEAMLESQDITRSQFVDRLSGTLFPGETVYVMLASDSNNVAFQPVSNKGEDQAEKSLLIVRETYFYIAPLYTVEPEVLDKLDQVDLTNGTISVKIKFCEL
jgi:hypothetical protein